MNRGLTEEFMALECNRPMAHKQVWINMTDVAKISKALPNLFKVNKVVLASALLPPGDHILVTIIVTKTFASPFYFAVLLFCFCLRYSRKIKSYFSSAACVKVCWLCADSWLLSAVLCIQLLSKYVTCEDWDKSIAWYCKQLWDFAEISVAQIKIIGAWWLLNINLHICHYNFHSNKRSLPMKDLPDFSTHHLCTCNIEQLLWKLLD